MIHPHDGVHSKEFSLSIIAPNNKLIGVSWLELKASSLQKGGLKLGLPKLLYR